MRYVRDLIILAMLLIIAAGVHWYQKTNAEKELKLRSAHEALRLMQQEVRLKAAMAEGELNSRGWPMTIDPRWFPSGAPRNPLVDRNRPWVELARPEEAGLQHPPIRMTVDRNLAGYWYNPYQGVVRARVPVMVSDDEARDLYNDINDCRIASIFWIETAPMQETEVAAAKRDAAQSATTEAVNNFTASENTDLDPTKPRPEPEPAADAPSEDGQVTTAPEIQGPPRPEEIEQATAPTDEQH